MRGVVRGVVRVSWGCHEGVVRVSWGCREGVVRVSWGCREGVVRVSWGCCEGVVRCSEMFWCEMFWDVLRCCGMFWDVVRVCVMLWDVVKCCEMLDVRFEIWDYDFHIFLFKLFFDNIKIHNMAMMLYVRSCGIFSQNNWNQVLIILFFKQTNN